MPSNDQIQELLDNCTSEWVTFNGANGRKFMSKNNEGTIFLPAAGDRCYVGLFSAGSNGDYWSSTQGPSDSYGAYGLGFDSDNAYWGNGYYNLRNGLTVRPVSR